MFKDFKKYEIEALGTLISIYLYKNNSKFIKNINHIIREFEKQYSRFLSDSKVSYLNKNKYKKIKIDEEFLDLIEQALFVSSKTQGYFDITLNKTLNKLGYVGFDNFKENFLLFVVSYVLNFGDSVKIFKKSNQCRILREIDLGGIGKGYLVDKIALYLKKNNISDFIINAGGDIYVSGIKSYKIFLENPLKENSVIGEINLNNMAFCSSSPKYRKFRNSHHLIDPKKNLSSNINKQVYVIAKQTSLADALATAFFVMDAKMALKIAKKLEVEILVIDKDNNIFKTENFNCEIYS